MSAWTLTTGDALASGRIVRRLAGGTAHEAFLVEAAGRRAVAKVPRPHLVDDPHCLRYTGSLVVAARNAREDRNAGTQAQSDAADAAGTADRGRCVYSSGRAYSQDDLRRTGQTDIGRALQMLDPSVTIGH